MSNELANFGDAASASVTRGAQHDETLGIQGVYHVMCRDSEGNIKWEDDAPNLVTAVGKQALFDYYFGATGTAGGTASGANYLGLCGGTATYTAADTMSSHTWTEVGGTNAPTYSGTRKTPAFSAATSANPSVLSTSAAVVFSMTGSGTVYGAFINVGGSTAIDNTTGTLFSIGAFTAGSKTVTSGDTINVTYTLSAAG